jgi:hypothetical protein
MSVAKHVLEPGMHDQNPTLLPPWYCGIDTEPVTSYAALRIYLNTVYKLENSICSTTSTAV